MDSQQSSSKTWTVEEENILSGFCDGNPEFANESACTEEALEKLLDLIETLEFKFSIEEARSQIKKHFDERNTLQSQKTAVEVTSKEWTKEEDDIFQDYCKQNPALLKNDERSRNTREKLWTKLSESLNNKFTKEDLHLKLIDNAGKWRSTDIEQLIEYYEKHEFLWDASLIEYKNRGKRNMALEEISRNLSYRKSASEISTKFENLKTTFLNNIKKGTTGDGSKGNKPWPYLQSLMFLKKQSIQSQSFTNANQPEASQNPLQNSDTNSFCQDDSQLQENSQSPSQLDATYPKLGTKRKHRKFGENQDHDLRKKLIQCLDNKPTAADAFGTNVAETLKKFTDVNQEMVKAQIQSVMAQCMAKQEKEESMPIFVQLQHI